MKRVAVVQGTLLFQLDDGQSISCNCIKDQYAQDIADDINLLIAAAPDMLEAPQGVLRVADRKTDEFDAARAAIAKATGVAGRRT